MSYRIRKSEQQEITADQEFAFEATGFVHTQDNLENAQESDVYAIEQLLESADSEKVTLGMRELGNVTDSNWLEYFAVTGQRPESRISAVNALGNQLERLAEVVKFTEHPDSRFIALDKISLKIDDLEDEGTLALIASEHNDPKIRSDAFEKVENEDMLVKIARFSKYEDSRWKAIEKLYNSNTEINPVELNHNEVILRQSAQIFVNDKSENESIRRMERLLENFKEVKSESNRKDLGELVTLAKYDSWLYVAAIESIAKYSASKTCRLKGVEILGTEEKLLRIVIESQYDDSRIAALKKLESKMESIEDEEILFELARKSKNQDVREKAVERICDNNLLAKMVTLTKYKEVRECALSKLEEKIDGIEDAEILKLISRMSKNKERKNIAKTRVDKLKNRKTGPLIALKNPPVVRTKEYEQEENEYQEIKNKGPDIPKTKSLFGRLKALFEELIDI